jgi:hypothetical protein
MASFNIKKILHLHSGKEGGAERFFVNLAHAFHEREIEQKFCIRPRRSWRSEIDNLGEIIYYYKIKQVSPKLEARCSYGLDAPSCQFN